MGCFSRRSFIKVFFSGVLFPFLHSIQGKISSPLGRLSFTESRAGVEKGLFPDFRGEELRYQIGFLWFKQAAIGKILFEKGEGNQGHKAILEGKTSGMIGWLTRYRRDIYTSYMEVIDGGKRFRPLRFEEDVVIGDKVRKRITLFDYGAGKLTKRRMNRRGVFIQTEERIPQGVVYDDFLTAFYNFRGGVYGKIERGKRYRVMTLPKKGVSTIDMEIATKEEEMRRRHGEGNKGPKEYYVTLFLDKEITRSRTGRVQGWVSKNLVPIEGTIEDVVLFGDVHGVLIGERRPS
jgi:hypothetical protein